MLTGAVYVIASLIVSFMVANFVLDSCDEIDHTNRKNTVRTHSEDNNLNNFGTTEPGIQIVLSVTVFIILSIIGINLV